MNNFRRPFNGKRTFRQAGAHRIKSFDPSALVKKLLPTVNQTVQDTFVPKHKFDEFGFDQQLVNNISERNYEQLTQIQDLVIPQLISGRDVVGIANTGSGKTAAFLTPLIQKVLADRNQKVLIMAPTRELAMQIDNEFRLFSKNLKLHSALCIGGVGSSSQIYKLRLGPNFVIGTPGRLKDFASQNILHLKTFNNVVLDEVDRILDMGFVKDMTEILSFLPKPRQSAFFSATSTPEVNNIMRKFLNNPLHIAVKANTTIDNVKQQVVSASGRNKIEVLQTLLIKPGFDKVLVFGRTKHGLDKLAVELGKRGFKVSSIHGNKSQYQRQRSLDEFKNNFVKILLATDIASRGLDIDDVTHVINYDLPESYEDYVHRIGRTGRANKTGVALTLVN